MTETVIFMPRLADTLVEGTVARWLKHVGQPIAAGEPLASIETDKVTTELTSPASGTLLEVLAAEGETVPVDTAIARIGAPGEAPAPEVEALALAAAPPEPTPAPAEPHAAQTEPAGPQAEPRAAPMAPAGPDDGAAPAKQALAPTEPAGASLRTPKADTPRPTPVAARLLAEHGLAANDVGAGKRVTKADVLRYLERQPSTATAADLVPLTSMRKAIAEHMVRAAQTIPHGQTVMQADLTALAAWRDREKSAFGREYGAPLTYTVCFVHAFGRALASRQSPVDLGVAVALDAGLIVPVIRAADALSLGETARAVQDVAARARSGKLQPAETQGALMTVTNVGSFGNLFAAPIVPLQQIGILGPGLVERRPLATADGGIKHGWRCLLTLMFDRRAFDDLAADRLLRSVCDELLSLP